MVAQSWPFAGTRSLCMHMRSRKSSPVWKSKFYGAFVLNRRDDLHVIDATPARWRGNAGSSPLDRARTAAPSPRNDLVKNCRAPVALVDFHTGAERDMGRAGPFRATHRPVQRRGQMLSRQMLRTPRSGPQIARGTGRFPGQLAPSNFMPASSTLIMADVSASGVLRVGVTVEIDHTCTLYHDSVAKRA